MSVEQDLFVRELGQVALDALQGVYRSKVVDRLVESDAVRVLQAVQDILDDGDLSDFDCVEKLVCLFEDNGISTSRHDFG